MLHPKRTPKKKPRRGSKRRRLLTAQAATMLSLVLVISLYFTVMAAAKCTYTITDGDNVTIHTSTASDVDQVLEEAGIDVDVDDLVTATGSGSSTEIRIQRSRCVTVTYQGVKNSTATYDATVQDLLGELNIALGADDIITSEGQALSVNEKIYDGMDIEITCNTQETVTETVAIPHNTVTYLDPTLELGTTVVKTEGVDGQQEITYLNEYVAGQLSASTVVGTKLLSPAVDEVILQGSKAPSPNEDETAVEIYTEPEPEPEPEPEEEDEPVYEDDEDDAPVYDDYDDYDDSSWDYEDDSEDYDDYDDYDDYEEPSYDGDYSTSGSTITTSSGEVLSYVDCLTMEATAYCGGGTTATGTPARYGAIAVDPRVIPYGTRMYIVSEDGNWIYGEATAEDCGGAIKGNIIDLYFDSYNTCIQFGRRNCTVYILEWG